MKSTALFVVSDFMWGIDSFKMLIVNILYCSQPDSTVTGNARYSGYPRGVKINDSSQPSAAL